MEKLTDIELTSVQSQEPRNHMVNSNANSILIQEDDVETPYGNFHVAIQGDRSKVAILTFHDIGLNHVTCFQGFFNFSDIQPILKHFCVYHVNAPGQEEGSLHLKPEHDVLGNPESLGNRYVGSCLALAVCIFINVFFFFTTKGSFILNLCEAI